MTAMNGPDVKQDLMNERTTNREPVIKTKPGVDRLIKELSREDTLVNLRCNVVAINSKAFQKNGLTLTRYYGLLEDATGTIAYSAWHELDIARNDVIRLTNARVREWQGMLKINIEKNTLIEKIDSGNSVEGTPHLVLSRAPKCTPINMLKPDETDVCCTCRIVSIEPIEVKVNDEVKTVYKGILADQSGSIRFTAWEDFILHADMVIDIQFASVKVWHNFLELNLNRSTKVLQKPQDSLPAAPVLALERVISIEDLYDRPYLPTPEFVVEGTIIEFRTGSGLISRCPTCTRAINADACPVHGKVNAITDLRLKAIVDDGTGAVSVIIGRELAESMLGRTLDECSKHLSDSADFAAANAKLIEPLLLGVVRLKGDIIRDEFGVSILASALKLIEFDKAKARGRALGLLEAMGQ